jgi:hypothetical protein
MTSDHRLCFVDDVGRSKEPHSVCKSGEVLFIAVEPYPVMHVSVQKQIRSVPRQTTGRAARPRHCDALIQRTLIHADHVKSVRSHEAAVGSIIFFTSVIFVAANPLISACLRMMASSLAR